MASHEKGDSAAVWDKRERIVPVTYFLAFPLGLYIVVLNVNKKKRDYCHLTVFSPSKSFKKTRDDQMLNFVCD